MAVDGNRRKLLVLLALLAMATLALLGFPAHALAVAARSDWRHALLVPIAAVPLLTIASIAGMPGTENFQVAAVVELTGRSIFGLGIGALVWGLTYAAYGDTIDEALR